jgi:hypothetical protein
VYIDLLDLDGQWTLSVSSSVEKSAPGPVHERVGRPWIEVLARTPYRAQLQPGRSTRLNIRFTTLAEVEVYGRPCALLGEEFVAIVDCASLATHGPPARRFRPRRRQRGPDRPCQIQESGGCWCLIYTRGYGTRVWKPLGSPDLVRPHRVLTARDGR